MFVRFLQSINWVDVVLVIILVRVIFIAVKNGFITELCKLLGVLLATILSLHFYVVLAHVLPNAKNYESTAETLAFVILFSIGYALFWGIRLGLGLLFKAETQHEGFDKYAAGVLAVARGLLTVSLIIFVLILSRFSFLEQQALKSVSFKMVGRTAVHVYHVVHENVISKFVENSVLNKAVWTVIETKSKVAVH